MVSKITTTQKHFLSIFFTLLLIIIFNSTAISQLAGYRGSMPVVVHNISGTAINNSTVLVRINTQALISLGLLLPNGNDIRFGSDCGGSVLYNYYIEGYLNTDTTKIWVMVPAVAANDSARIYMYFGNAAAVSASNPTGTFNGPWSSTDSVATGAPGGVANSQRGFRFTPNANILVTSFGKREPTGTTRYITLFDFTSQQVIKQKQISGPSAQYVYDTLGSPVWLNSGQQYLIEIFQGAGDGYYFGTSSQISPFLTYGDMRFCNTCTQNTFPTSTLSGYHYGYADLLYYVISNPVSPAPVVNSLQPADTNTPAAPASLAGTPGNQTVNLNWHKNLEFDVSKYYIYQNTTNNPATATLRDSTIHPDTVRTIGGLVNGTPYFFWVRAKDAFCSPRISAFSTVFSATPVAISQNGTIVPKVFALYQNFPNPFNPSSVIQFDIPKTSFVHLTIYDILGRKVATLVNQTLTAGRYNMNWDGSNYASGVYFYKLEAGDFTDRKKMILEK